MRNEGEFARQIVYFELDLIGTKNPDTQKALINVWNIYCLYIVFMIVYTEKNKKLEGKLKKKRKKLLC